MGFTKLVAKSALIAGVFVAGLVGITGVARAQSIEDTRVDLHPMGLQVGVVTSIQGHTAWIRLPYKTKLGATADMMPYSDAGFPLATGKVAWMSPVKPWDALVVDITPKTTKYPINDYDDYWAIGSFGVKQTNGVRPDNEAFGTDLTIEHFARVPALDVAGDHDGVEPVHALVAALRERKNKTASDIASAVEAAFSEPGSNVMDDNTVVDGINYAVMFENLRHFRFIQDGDSVTMKLYAHLIKESERHDFVGKIPGDSLRDNVPAPTKLPGT